jgi:hypothetical protein
MIIDCIVVLELIEHIKQLLLIEMSVFAKLNSSHSLYISTAANYHF